MKLKISEDELNTLIVCVTTRMEVCEMRIIKAAAEFDTVQRDHWMGQMEKMRKLSKRLCKKLNRRFKS